MRVLIIGASGLVGWELYRKFKNEGWEVLGTYNNFQLPGLQKLDFTVSKEAEKAVGQFKPDVVIQPAAYANVDGCEKDPALCYKVNRDGVRNLIDACKSSNPLYVYFSTDYIFKGDKGPNKENDKPDPQGIYAKVKLEMEDYLKIKLKNYLIVRTANVFGNESQGKNFVIRLVASLKEGKEIKVVNDQSVNPTYVGSLSEAVFYLVKHNKKGVFHIAGTTIMNRFEYARLIAEVFKLDKSLIKPIKTEQTTSLVKRPTNGGLLTIKVQKVLLFKLLSAREGLEEMRKKILNPNL